VSLVIKSEEQSFSQNLQVNVLNAEAETLEEELKEAQRVIHVFKNSQKKGVKMASNLMSDLSGKLKDLQASSKEKSAHFAGVQGSLEDSFVPISVSSSQVLLELFSAIEFQGVKTREPTSFSRLAVKSIMGQLAAVEENIVALLTWQSYVHTSYNGMLTGKVLERMTNKRFDHSPVSIKSTYADSMLEEDDLDDIKTPLHVDQFRQRVKSLLQRTPIDAHKSLRGIL